MKRRGSRRLRRFRDFTRSHDIARGVTGAHFSKLHVACCLLYVVCSMLHASAVFYTKPRGASQVRLLWAVCCMLFAVHAACCISHCMLYAACCLRNGADLAPLHTFTRNRGGRHRCSFSELYAACSLLYVVCSMFYAIYCTSSSTTASTFESCRGPGERGPHRETAGGVTGAAPPPVCCMLFAVRRVQQVIG